MASGINNTFRLGGVAVGVAVLGALMEKRVEEALSASTGAHAHVLAAAVSSAGVHAVAGHPELVEPARAAFVTGLNAALVTGSALLVVGALAAFTLLRTPAPAPAPAQQPETEAA
jgi:DHA2 family multidrug resistance protein-like MFS transporter